MADDQLNALIDQMEKAGETPEDIAAVVKTWNPNAMSIADKQKERAANLATQADVVNQQADVPAAMKRGGLEGASRGALEFGKRLARTPLTATEGVYNTVAHPIDSALSLPGALYGGAKTAFGAVDTAIHPIRTLMDPMSPAKQFTETLRQTSSQPELLARQGGDLAGAIALGKVAPAAPEAAGTAVRASSRATGHALKLGGKGAGWPLRMVGAHQLGMGNPLGIAVMAIPEVLTSVGDTLLRWGTKEGAALGTPAGQLLKLRADLAKAGKNPSATLLQQTRDVLSEMQASVSRRIDIGKLDTDVPVLKKEFNELDNYIKQIDNKLNATAKTAKSVDPIKKWSETARSENARDAYLRKQQAQDATNLNTQEAKLSGFQQDIAKDVSSSVDAIPGAAEGLDSLDQAIATQRAEARATRTRAAKTDANATRAEQTADKDWYQQQQRTAAEAEASTKAGWKQEATNLNARENYINKDNAQEAVNRNAEQSYRRKVEVDRDLADREAAARAATENVEPPSGAAAGSLSPIEVAELKKLGYTDETIAKMSSGRASVTPAVAPLTPSTAPPVSPSIDPIEAAMSRRAPQKPITDIPPSRSSGAQGPGSQMSATHGLTVNDVETLGMNPAIKITKLTDAAKQYLLAERRRRGASYGEMYRLEKMLKEMTTAPTPGSGITIKKVE